MSWSSSEMPNTVLPAWVVVRIIGWWDGSRRCSDLILAASLLTVMSIVMQHETIMAGTCIWTNGVSTLMLTTSIVSCTFINVCSKWRNVVKVWCFYSSIKITGFWMGTKVLQNSAVSIFRVGNEAFGSPQKTTNIIKYRVTS